jgi:hypothetical protein
MLLKLIVHSSLEKQSFFGYCLSDGAVFSYCTIINQDVTIVKSDSDCKSKLLLKLTKAVNNRRRVNLDFKITVHSQLHLYLETV